MSKQAQAKPTVSRPPDKPEEDPLAYEMWLTNVVEHGPVEQRGAAEDLLLEELQRPGPRKQSGNQPLKKNVSK
ncbi:MAG: hypothetical protein CO149_01615 [Nitrospirae bacterium CG_4_9_14_3_um_filter_51_5]|nr:MAG: hypothetical protein CO149_01615 [Nitrospirae bacterium CG_4_9_14_3_um_filter_51_5]